MPFSASTSSICRVSGWGIMLLGGLALPGAASLPMPCPSPLRLAVYYGYPSLVNGAQGDFEVAVAVFSNYDVIVLGDGLEFDATRSGQGAGPSEHTFAERLVQRLRRMPRDPEVYGYVDLGRTQQLPLSEIATRIDLWAHMGAAGVFFDEAGYDFGVSRERQNAAVTAAHAHGLRACLNAFRPDDVFSETRTPLNALGGGNPDGIPPVLTGRDSYLLESFAVRLGVAEDVEGLAARTRVALQGRARFSTRTFALATAVDGDQALAAYGWWMASALGLDAYGWGAPSLTAIASRLPWVPRPDVEETLARARYVGEIVIRESHWRRTTTAGTIVVDIAGHRGALEQY
jgi:hypothetical protein